MGRIPEYATRFSVSLGETATLTKGRLSVTSPYARCRLPTQPLQQINDVELEGVVRLFAFGSM